MGKETALPFTKMHGCGNDYVYLDALACEEVPSTTSALKKLAIAVSDRHTGIGGAREVEARLLKEPANPVSTKSWEVHAVQTSR